MGIRWYLCPVEMRDIEYEDDVERVRAPRVRFLIEPGRNKNYQYTAAIAVKSWCLVKVLAEDWTAIEADSQCIRLLEGDEDTPGLLDKTPRQLGFSAARMIRIRDRLQGYGVDTTGLTMDSTLEEILDRVVQALAPYFKARLLRIKGL